MRAPDRLTVPTCIGCGAMSLLGTCDTGCSEHKLELVRAAAHDAVRTAESNARTRANAFVDLARHLAGHDPRDGEYEAAYRSAQSRARELLRRRPALDQPATDWEEPAEPATTWWCAECGGLDAPQPCLGICVWRPVEWVERGVYEQLRARAMAEHEREQRLRHLVARVAWVTPRSGQWEVGWRLVRDEARRIVDASVIARLTDAKQPELRSALPDLEDRMKLHADAAQSEWPTR